MAKNFDPKYAPKNIAKTLSGDNDKASEHHQQVMNLLSKKSAKRSEVFLRLATEFVESWRDDYPESYQKETPQQLTLAAIVAASIKERKNDKAT